jgi:ribA/ribD-fused uncharacterized protein
MTKIKRHRQDFMNADGVVVPEITATHIYGLFGPYRALSNFHKESLVVDGITFWSSEAAYMAQKTDILAEKLALSRIVEPSEVKKAGQKVTLRANWDAVKADAMLKVLREKFGQSQRLADLLLATGDLVLEETNWWGDTFWGVCGGVGRNELGRALMIVRDEMNQARRGIPQVFIN